MSINEIMKNFIFLCIVFLLFFVSCTGTDSEEEAIVESSTEESIPDLPYSQIPVTQYLIDVDYWDIPTNGTDALKTTDNLQAAIDWAVEEGYGIIRLPAGHYLIGKYQNASFQSGIKLKSNMAFLLDDDATIEMVPNDLTNYYVIGVREQKYVVISGGVILGDRDEHMYVGTSAHGGGHCIAITHESEYVTIENMKLSKATGDGILLQGYAGENSSVKHIDIRGNEMFKNRRQGISIVGGENIVIEDNEIHHIQGTAPQFGIDIESEIYFSENIEIRNNYFHHNRGGDIVNFDAKNVLIEDNIIEQGEGGNYTDGAVVLWVSEELIMRDNIITAQLDESKLTWCGVIMYPNENCKLDHAVGYISNNTFTNCGLSMHNGSDLSINDNDFVNGFVNLKDMVNLKLDNNKVKRDFGICRNYFFDNVSGSASGNTLSGVAFDVPLGNEPYSGDSCD